MSTNFVNHCVCACVELMFTLCNKVETIPLYLLKYYVVLLCIYECFAACMPVLHPGHDLCLLRWEEGTGSPETEVLDSCELLCGYCVHVSRCLPLFLSSSYAILLLFYLAFFVSMLFPCNSKVSYMASNLSTSNLYTRPLKIWLLTFWFFSVAFIFYINYFLTSFLGLILSRCKWLKLKSFGHFFCNIELLRW